MRTRIQRAREATERRHHP